MRRVKPPWAECLVAALACLTGRLIMLQGQMFPRAVELGEGSPRQRRWCKVAARSGVLWCAVFCGGGGGVGGCGGNACGMELW